MYGLVSSGNCPIPTVLKQYKKSIDLIDLKISETTGETGICPVQFPIISVKKVADLWRLDQLSEVPQFMAGYYPLVEGAKKYYVTTIESEVLICLSQLGNYTGYQCCSIDKLPRNWERLMDCNISPLIVYGVNSSNIDKAKTFLQAAKAYPRPVIFGVSSDWLTLGLDKIEGKCYLGLSELQAAPLREYGAEKLRSIVRESYSTWLENGV